MSPSRPTIRSIALFIALGLDREQDRLNDHQSDRKALAFHDPSPGTLYARQFGGKRAGLNYSPPREKHNILGPRAWRSVATASSFPTVINEMPPERSGSHQTHCWREMDSNFRFRER